MRDLNYQLKQLCARNRDGSYSTQANRQRILDLVARQLSAMGYRRMSTHSLKPKHVDALVRHWMSEGMTPGTIKNRMNCLRWCTSSPPPPVTRPQEATLGTPVAHARQPGGRRPLGRS